MIEFVFYAVLLTTHLVCVAAIFRAPLLKLLAARKERA